VTKIEDMQNTELFMNVISSLEQLERMIKYKNANGEKNFLLEVRTYTTSPVLLYAQLNNKVFVEQYHCGITDEEKSSSLRKCIGKKVPMLEFRQYSLSAQLYAAHFQYIWDESKARVLNENFIKQLRNDFREKIFLGTEEYHGETENLLSLENEKELGSKIDSTTTG